jgi:MFS family permease
MNTAVASLPSEHLFGGGRLGPCVGAVALISLLAFEAMAVSTAMPAIAGALDGLALYALAFGGPLAASVLAMALAGPWSDRRGAWLPSVAGLLLFAAGLLLAGLAIQMPVLVAGRLLQGLGGGMLGVTLYVGMGQVVPAALHPRLFGLFAAAWVLPGLVGPTLAALMVNWWGWRSVFLLVLALVPLAAAFLLPAFRRLPVVVLTTPGAAAASATRSTLRWAAIGAAGALLLHGLSSLNALWKGAALVAGLVAVVWAASQLLPRGTLLARPGLPSVVALRALLAAAFASAEVFIPLMLTGVHGWTLVQAGVALSTGAVFWSLGSAVQSRIQLPARRRQGLVLGSLLMSTGILGVALPLLLGWSTVWVVLGWGLAGLGIGLAFPMLSVLTLSLSAPGEQGRNASALQLGDALGCSAALAVAGALFNAAGASASAVGSLWVLGFAGLLALTGALLAPRAFA